MNVSKDGIKALELGPKGWEAGRCVSKFILELAGSLVQ